MGADRSGMVVTSDTRVTGSARADNAPERVRFRAKRCIARFRFRRCATAHCQPVCLITSNNEQLLRFPSTANITDVIGG